MALISTEDLAGLDDDITDSSEPMDDEEQDRMYNQTSQQQQVPFVTISRHEKGKSLGEVLYEERVYPPGTWACVSKADTLYEQSISNAFMKLMRLICKENSTGRYLGMSVPVDVLTAYYLPAELQTRPPEPTDPDIRIVHRDAIRVIARYTNTLPSNTVQMYVKHQCNSLPFFNIISPFCDIDGLGCTFN
uniref:Heme-binding protein soul4 n=1 Tax=Cyprinus carpio TaxID=7962 RepID=A0A8C2JLW4_CYPCA